MKLGLGPKQAQVLWTCEDLPAQRAEVMHIASTAMSMAPFYRAKAAFYARNGIQADDAPASLGEATLAVAWGQGIHYNDDPTVRNMVCSTIHSTIFACQSWRVHSHCFCSDFSLVC